MKLNNQNTRILKYLFKADQGLFTFTLFQRLNVSPKDLFESMVALQELDLINEENDRLSLTSKGKEFIINNKLSSSSINKFEKIPNAFIGRKIDINEFYLPKNSTIYQEFISSEPKDIGGTKETSTKEV